MFEDIDKAAGVLANAKAGWVDRRDAAESLGEAAFRALSVLNAHRHETDVDVCAAVEKAFNRGSQGPERMPFAKPAACSFDDLARACAKTGERTVTRHEQGYAIDVQLKEGRHQRVFLTAFERKDGVKLIRVFTYCGKPTPESLQWSLEVNMKLTRGALALCGKDADLRLVLVDCYPAGEATPHAVKTSVKEIAHYGDWIEQKLTGLDEL